MDDGDQWCPELPEIRTVSRRLPADQDSLAAVIAALAGARRPALVIGGAVDQVGGWEDAIALAERLQCAVWAAPEEGRPGFPESHALYQGMLPPAIGPLSQALSGHDVIVVLGAPVFRYYPFVPGRYLPEGAELFHITDDPSEAARAPVGTAVLADPGRACAVLGAAIPRADRQPPTPRSVPTPVVNDDRITPEWLYHTIQAVRPADSVIVQESLSTVRQLREQIPTDASRSFFSMASGVLGYGIAAGVGVALAERDEATHRKVICIVGDGSANYVIQALWTAAQHDLPILFVVVRNSAYNILKSFAHLLQTPGVPGLDLPGVDFVSLASGYGCTGSRVTSGADLHDALKLALASEHPYLLEVTVDPTVPPLI